MNLTGVELTEAQTDQEVLPETRKKIRLKNRVRVVTSGKNVRLTCQVRVCMCVYDP